jgi:hypothetical protein
MKVKQNHKQTRLSLFCHSQETEGGLVKIWSRERAPKLNINCATTHQPRSVKNVNVKAYESKPIYEDKYIDKAYEYKIEHSPVFIKPYDNGPITMTKADHSATTRVECRAYLKALTECNCTSFDAMMTVVSSFYCIHIKESVWENSTCTCKEASKHYKCFHMVILSAKLRGVRNAKTFDCNT